MFAAVAAHDPDAIVRHAAKNVHDDFVAVREMHGREEVRRFFAEVFAAFSDFTIAADRIVGDERTAVVQMANAIFTGKPFLGGRRASLKGVDVMEIDAGPSSATRFTTTERPWRATSACCQRRTASLTAP